VSECYLVAAKVADPARLLRTGGHRTSGKRAAQCHATATPQRR